MAVYYARKSGNVNATDVWSTTPSGSASDLFSSFNGTDTLMSNSFTVTLNVNTTVAEIKNDNSNSATGGGSFVLNSGVTLTANVTNGSTATATLSYTGSGTASIIGNITGGTQTSSRALTFNNGLGTLNITGNIIGGSGGSGSAGISFGAAGTLNITGNVVGGSSNGGSTGVVAQATGTLVVSGSVTGGSSNFINYGILMGTNFTGTVTIIGVVNPGILAAGVANNSSATINITRARGNNFGPGSTGLTNVVAVAGNQNGRTRIYELEYGSLGNSPTSGPIEIINDSTNVAIFAVRNSSPKTLVDLNNAANLIPTPANVRSGVSYNYGNSVGTCVIPNANSVVYGVRVDNTIGSGLLSPAAVWNYLTTSISTSGSIGERLKNCSTVASVGKQLEGAL